MSEERTNASRAAVPTTLYEPQVLFICALITASLLFVQYAVSGALELLILASGYLFTALIVVPYALTFPGAFAPTGLLGAGVANYCLALSCLALRICSIS